MEQAAQDAEDCKNGRKGMLRLAALRVKTHDPSAAANSSSDGLPDIKKQDALFCYKTGEEKWDGRGPIHASKKQRSR